MAWHGTQAVHSCVYGSNNHGMVCWRVTKRSQRRRTTQCSPGGPRNVVTEEEDHAVQPRNVVTEEEDHAVQSRRWAGSYQGLKVHHQ